jgi:hypothetical protein
MENIKVFNNFLNTQEISIIKNILNNNKWIHGHTSINDFYTIPFWYMELFENDYLKYSIKEKIESITKKKFEVVRLYANGQTYGQHGTYHQDDTDDLTFTFCLYFTEYEISIEDIIGGNFEIKIPNEVDFHMSIPPRFNRGILFPSNYFHKGNSFDRFITDVRICIAWKLITI